MRGEGFPAFGWTTGKSFMFRRTFFRGNWFTAEFYPYLTAAVSILAGFTLKEKLFGYYIWNDVIYNGSGLKTVYAVCTGVTAGFGCIRGRKSLWRILLMGMTPAMAVLTVRWWIEGFSAARLLSVLFAAYFLSMAVQIINRILKKKEVLDALMAAISRCLTALALLSAVGTAGYCAFGGGPMERDTHIILAKGFDDRGWDANREMLSKWQEENYAELSKEERLQLWQDTVDLEAAYWGHEAPAVVAEEYDAADNKDGYYSQELNVISVRNAALDYPREYALNILLHESNHAYNQAIANSVDWDDKDVDRNLRMYKEAYVFKEAGEKYVLPEENEDAYLDNPLEKAARQYADEWVDKYLAYIDAGM